MVLYTGDEFPEEIQRLGFKKERDLRWLWYYLACLFRKSAPGGGIPSESSMTQDERNQGMARFIQNNRISLSGIKVAHREYLIDESHFKWLDKGDDRLLIWMLIAVKPIANLVGRFYPHTSESWSPSDISTPEARRSEIILALDLLEIPGPLKAKFLEETRRQWVLCKTPDKDTRWINPKGTDQLHWALNYLCKAGQEVKLGLTPIDNTEHYTYTLASLDQMLMTRELFDRRKGIIQSASFIQRRRRGVAYARELSVQQKEGEEDVWDAAERELSGRVMQGAAEKELFLIKMRKTWAQKKYRASEKARTQRYMPLTEDARSKLKRLAEQKNVKRHELIEGLIQKEFEQAFPGSR